MTRDEEQVSVPPGGTAVTYDDGFSTPEAPVIPYIPGVDEALLSATRRVLDAAAERMGRKIHWMRVPGRVEEDDGNWALPPETVRAIRRFRLAFVGPLADSRAEALAREDELRRRLDITVAATRYTGGSRSNTDIVLFREVSEDATAGLEYGPDTEAAAAFEEFAREREKGDRIPDGPTGYSVSPISRNATESLVETAVEYAFDNDRNSLAIAHQGDLRAAAEGSFLKWAREYITAEYGDSIVDETTFREAGGVFPDDELVFFERRTDELCQGLVTDLSVYDVVLAPALGGMYVSAVASGITGVEGPAELGVGDGSLVAFARSPRGERSQEDCSNPVSLVLAGCLLFDYLGWADTASTVRTAVASALDDGALTREVPNLTQNHVSANPDEVAEILVDRIQNPNHEEGSGGVQSSPAERARIKEAIAALYSTVFEDSLSADAVELNQLLGEDEEADVYLPEVGLNFTYWRRWSVERKLEVLLHELAHVEEEAGEADHGDAFYERLCELTDIAADWQPELEDAFGEPIDFDLVRWFVVESVHEETIEPEEESIADRKRWLRERFDLDRNERY